MARLLYGGTSGDFLVAQDSGNADALVINAGATITVYNARTGGSQIVDLQLADSTPVSVITSAADGSIPVFYGPDSYEDDLWGAAAGLASRFRIPAQTSTIFGRLATLEAFTSPSTLGDLSNVNTTGATYLSTLVYDPGTATWKPGQGIMVITNGTDVPSWVPANTPIVRPV